MKILTKTISTTDTDIDIYILEKDSYKLASDRFTILPQSFDEDNTYLYRAHLAESGDFLFRVENDTPCVSAENVFMVADLPNYEYFLLDGVIYYKEHSRNIRKHDPNGAIVDLNPFALAINVWGVSSNATRLYA